MSDLPTLLNTGKTITVAGKPVRVKHLTLAQLADLQTWVDSHQPNLIGAVLEKVKDMPGAAITAAVEAAAKAMAKTRILVGSPESVEYFMGAQGTRELAVRTILAGGSVADRLEAESLVDACTMEELGQIVRNSGFFSLGDTSDPKVPSDSGTG